MVALARISRTIGSSWGLSSKLVIWAYKVWLSGLGGGIEAGTHCLRSEQGTAYGRLYGPVHLPRYCYHGDGGPALPTTLVLSHHRTGSTAMHRLKVWDRWTDFKLDGRRSLNSHVKALRSTEELFPMLSIPFLRYYYMSYIN